MSDDPNTNSGDEKLVLRKLAQVRRARVSAEYGSEGRRLLSRKAHDLVENCRLDQDAVIAGYHPIKDEIDCLGLLSAVRLRGFEIALPRMRHGEKVLDFYIWDIEIVLEEGAYGIRQPQAISPPVIPDLVVLPLLAFDQAGGRIGYGGGYYDRTLGALRREREITMVGVGFDEQEVEKVPKNDHDQLLDFVATPTRFIRISNG